MKHAAILFSLALAYASSAAAQSAWTLEQCLQHASEHNIQVQKSRISEQEAEQSLLQARAALFPTLSASMSQTVGYRPFQETVSMTQNGMVVNTDNRVTENGSYGLNANWTLWDGGINRKTIEQQKLQARIAETSTAQSLNSIQEQIAQLYVQILYSVEAERVNEKLAETARKQLNRGQERYDVGDLSRADVAQLESQLAQAEYDVVNSQTQVASYKRQLKELLQLDINEPFDIAETELEDEAALNPVPDKTAIYEAALLTRPEIQAAQLQADAANLQLDIARRGYYPTIGLNAGVGDSHYSASDDSYGTQLKQNLNASIGLSVSVPIFDNRRNKTSVEKAKLQQTSAALDILDKQIALGSTIENLWLQASSAQQRFLAARTAVQSQETNYELINEQFQAGLKNIVDLLQARDNLLQAQQNKLQSKYTTVLNVQLLRFYEGGQMSF
ncbi:MAG: TolC family protein [Bacteroidaceae bacterium]|nr:TolC family protein [Bacteroidaceae bacterium]